MKPTESVREKIRKNEEERELLRKEWNRTETVEQQKTYKKLVGKCFTPSGNGGGKEKYLIIGLKTLKRIDKDVYFFFEIITVRSSYWEHSGKADGLTNPEVYKGISSADVELRYCEWESYRFVENRMEDLMEVSAKEVLKEIKEFKIVSKKLISMLFNKGGLKYSEKIK